jgi:hypothetical protein
MLVGALGFGARALLAGQRALELGFRMAHAQQRAHRGQQHGRTKRLDQVHVRALIEAVGAILLGHGRLRHLQHLDAGRVKLGFQLAADIEAAHVRQVDVEHGQVGPLRPHSGEAPRRPCVLRSPRNRRAARIWILMNRAASLSSTTRMRARSITMPPRCPDGGAMPVARSMARCIAQCQVLARQVGLGQYRRVRSHPLALRFGQRPGRNHHDGDLAGARIALKGVTQIQAVHVSELQIEQHHGGIRPLRLPQPVAAAGGFDDLVIAPAQHFANDEPRRLLIVHQPARAWRPADARPVRASAEARRRPVACGRRHSAPRASAFCGSSTELTTSSGISDVDR